VIAVLNDIKAQIRSAALGGDKLAIHGAGSKAFYGEPLLGQPLDVSAYQGIVAYEPSELYLTARCGTPLVDIEQMLAETGQMLAFEAPHFAGATAGGCVASALAGPRRAYAGSVRDYVLGLKLIDGHGDVLSFGGQVMKNVAGFDVSRFVVGSLGCLGVISEVTFKLAPLPVAETTLRFELDQAAAINKINRLAGQALPISASAWLEGQLWLRLSGAEPAVDAARAQLGGEALPGAAIWSALREQTLPLFAAPRLWRLSLPATTAPLVLPGPQIIEWGGALRWLVSDADATHIRQLVSLAGGHATLYRGATPGQVFQPLVPALLQLHQRLKQRFDPHLIFNPGRMYPEL